LVVVVVVLPTLGLERAVWEGIGGAD
jgi:hypothetical protein